VRIFQLLLIMLTLNMTGLALASDSPARAKGMEENATVSHCR